MRPLVLIGLLLVVGGVIAMAIPSITFFTSERVADVGFFAIDVAKPHTIFLNPVVGGVAVVAGILMMLAGRRAS